MIICTSQKSIFTKYLEYLMIVYNGFKNIETRSHTASNRKFISIQSHFLLCCAFKGCDTKVFLFQTK